MLFWLPKSGIPNKHPTRGEKADPLRRVGCHRAFLAHPGTEPRLGVDVIPLWFRARRVDWSPLSEALSKSARVALRDHKRLVMFIRNCSETILSHTCIDDICKEPRRPKILWSWGLSDTPQMRFFSYPISGKDSYTMLYHVIPPQLALNILGKYRMPYRTCL